MSQEMDENHCSVVAYPPLKFTIKKEFIEPEELKMEEEGLDSAKSNGEMMNVHDDFNERSGHSSFIENDAGKSSDEESSLKEKEENQHPLAFPPVKFKQHIKQEPKDEEQCCELNLTKDITQDGESSNEGSTHSSLDGVETTDESSDEKPPPSLSTTTDPSTKGKAMKRASKTSHNRKKENSGINRRSAALLERRFKCDKCKNRFKSKAYLKDHLRRTCGKERSFLCKQCDSRFKRKCELKVHLIKIHKIDSSRLPEFGAGSQDRPVMPFKCIQCARSYKHQRSLSYHLRNVCGKDPTFFCNQCEYRTKRKKDLQDHLINVHDIKRAQLAVFGAGRNIRPVMAFKCDQCECTYKIKSSLKRHVREKHSVGK